MRVALLYDRVNSVGGAERVLQVLHRLYPNAPLYTSVFAPEKAPWAQGWDVRPSWLQRFIWARTHHQWFGWLMPLIFETLDLRGYDLVISVTSEAAKGVITQPHQRHVCYLLTPTRYLWSHTQEYAQHLPWGLRQVAQWVFAGLRAWDAVAAQRPDQVFVISKHVAQRLASAYGRSADAVVYPPLCVLPAAHEPKLTVSEPYFFAAGRHVRYKRFSLVIQSAVRLQQRIVLAGEGPDTPRLMRLARSLDSRGQYVHFVGWCSDAELHWWYQHAAAAIFPQVEDFGLTTLEALQAGCPVVVHARSGSAEWVRPGNDGVLLTEASVAALMSALQQILTTSWNRLDIQQHSLQYAGVHFDQSWKAALKSTEGKTYVTA